MYSVSVKGAVCIAAPASGSGKTLVTCALIRALRERGLTVQPFKAGPDYIDPLFHDKTAPEGGLHKCENLDTFLADHDTVRSIYEECSEGADISVIEGVMGLYDGVGGTQEKGSTYDLAACLGAPIILVTGAGGASRSILAVIRGFLDYDREGLIKGVILNRCSEGSFSRLAPLIEQELGIRALGYLPVMKDIHIESRYLGLTLPDEIVDIKLQIGKLAERMNESVDIDGILEIGRGT